MKIEQALLILGNKLEDFTIKGNCAYSSKLSICYRYSKIYDDKPIWWTSEYFNRAKSSDFVVITLENRGILVIPSKRIMDYWHSVNMGTLSNGRIKIRIKEEDGKIVLYNKKDQPTYDVTEHLH